MFGLELPWFINQTTSVTVFCPWSQRDVTARYLTRPGLPPILIGCDDTDCSMACLEPGREPAAPAHAHDRCEQREVSPTGVIDP